MNLEKQTKIVKAYVSRNLTGILIVCLCIVIVTTFFIAIRIYQIAIRETKVNQGTQQFEMARSAATGIEFFLHHLSQDLHSLASFPGLQYLEPEPLRSNVDYFFENSKQEGVETIFVVDVQNELVYSTSDSVPFWASELIGTKINNSGTDFQTEDVWFSRVTRKVPSDPNSELCVLMLVPLSQYFRDSIHPNPSNEFVGVTGYLLSFDWLMRRFLQPIRVGETGFAWMMDQHGRLLYHPRHPEMVLRSIFRPEPACRECHTSFDKQTALINDQFKSEEYQVGNEPVKIMAQAPMTFSNEKWIVAVSMDLKEVTAIMRKNYRLFFVLVGIVLVSVISGGVVLLIFNLGRARAETSAQLSEQRRVLQGQIDQAARLALIGELVDSVAHEINTPVGIIQARLGALQMKKQEIPYGDVVKVVLDQTRRIGDYTRNLLRISRRMPFQPALNNLPAIIEDCLLLLGHEIRKRDISVHTQWPNKLPLVEMDRDQMQQVILNVLKNAIDALDAAGEIRITVRRTNQSAEKRGFSIEIEDSGPGIPPEKVGRIFDPFFSTKPPSKGTGLGLPISRAIIARHNGTIEVESTVGEGTCFKIFLPQRIRKYEADDGEYPPG